MASNPNAKSSGVTRRDSPPIAIVGMSCLFPKANSLGEYWSNITRGVDGISDVPPTHWSARDYFDDDPKRPDHTYCRRGGFLSPVEFDPTQFGVSPHSIEATDTSQLLGLLAAHGALVEAGYGPGGRDFDRSRTSVILGVTGTLELAISLGARLGHPIWRKALAKAGVNGEIAERVVQSIGDSYVAWQEDSFPGLLGNVVAGRIANRLDLGGTNCVVDAACASSIGAAHVAVLELASGRADMAITGGVDAFNDIFMYMCFSKTPALSPTGDARPFDADADGTILGEGIGMVVLKRLDDAERDGDRIHAVIKGIGASSDGRGKAIYAPCASGQSKALEAAYEQADVTPDTIGLIEAHGTGTRVGDATEVAALKEVYRRARPDGVWCALGSVKSQIGHTKAAAGIAGVIKAALALSHKVLPPTIKVDRPNPAVEGGPFYVNSQKRPWLPRKGRPRRAAVSSFGFGGSNFHLVLEEHGANKLDADWDGRVQIVALSSDSEAGLRAKLAEWSDEAPWDERRRRARDSRRAFSSLHSHRLIFVVEREKTDFRRLTQKLAAQMTRMAGREHWSTPDGAFFGRSRRPRKLAFLFPGQGSQYVGMCLDLATLFPKMQEALARADMAYGDMSDLAMQLSDFIFPHATHAEESRRLNELALRATHVAQPAVGAISVGAICILSMFGIAPGLVAGHSFGELVALFASGRIDAAQLYDLSKLRGELMARGEGDRGAMLAVRASADEMRRLIEEERLDLVVANHNAPDQVVLSGATGEIERAAELLRARKKVAILLPVSAAFHSSLVAGAAEPFRRALEAIAFEASAIPVYANTTGAPYPDDANEARDLLGNQLARPVEFARTIEAMHAAGAETFVEVGPGRRLTGLVGAILGDREHVAIALDASAGRGDGVVDLARALAQLGALGHEVDLTPWDRGAFDAEWQTAPAAPMMKVAICGANAQPKRVDAAPSMHRASAPASVAIVEDSASSAPETAPDCASGIDGGAAPAPPPKEPPRERPMTAPAVEPQPNSFSHSPSAFSPAAPVSIDSALRNTQDHLARLQQLQEQTARLHRQFLDGQERAQQAIERLIEGQRTLYAFGAPPTFDECDERRFEPTAPAPDVAALVSEPTAEEPPPAPEPPPAEPIRDALLQIVADKTGYPIEMLTLEMDVEADLGIDSIKRVEILSAVQERLPDAPVVPPDRIGELRTLGRIVEFLSDSPARAETFEEGGSAANACGAAAPGCDTTKGGTRSDFEAALLRVVAEKTGYPTEMLALDMDIESDLGIDSIKRVEILSAFQEAHPDAPVVSPDDVGRLRTLAQILEHVGAAGGPAEARSGKSDGSDLSDESDLSTPSTLLSEAPALQQAVLRLAPLAAGARAELRLDANAPLLIVDDGAGLATRLAYRFESRGRRARLVSLDDRGAFASEPAIAGLVLLSPARVDDAWIERALFAVQSAGPALRRSAERGEVLLATVARMDGAFGLDDASAIDPLHGALAGLAKTARLEWPEVAARAIDLDARWRDDDAAAEALAAELLFAGPIEVGLSERGARAIELEDRAAPSNGVAAEILSPGDVVVVSGGARGVTAEAAVALARSVRPTLVLLGRTPRPGDEPAWLRGLESEAEIKRALLVEGNGAHPTPREIEKHCRRVQAGREIRRTLERIESAGARAAYKAVDVRDAEAVAAAIGEVRAEFGPIRALVHGAGVLADRRIEDKTREDFKSVWGVKVGGLRALLAALEGDDLRAIALFSSVTGRFGRVGQVDYAMANEALNKIARVEARRRPNARVVSFNWGPWAGGMVTPALERLFEAEGVGLIPLEGGARWFARELLHPADREVEIVVGGKFDRIPPAPVRAPAPSRPAPNRVKSNGASVGFECELSIERVPLLASHVFAGRPVLPVALAIEWLAHGALHAHPGLVFRGLDDLRVLKGVTLDNGAHPVRVVAGKAERAGEEFIVRVELVGGADYKTRHARADVILAAERQAPPAPNLKPALLTPYPRTPQAAYEDILFHGPALHAIESIEGWSGEGIAGRVEVAPPPEAWVADPPRDAWLADPAAVDAALQLAILWTFQRRGEVSLPSSIGAYRQYAAAFPRAGARVVLRVGGGVGSRTALADAEFLDDNGRTIARIDRLEMVMDASLMSAFRRRAPDAPATL